MIYGETPSLPKKADRADSAGAMNQSNNTPEGYANAHVVLPGGAPIILRSIKTRNADWHLGAFGPLCLPAAVN